jgi:hypothetical protein
VLKHAFLDTRRLPARYRDEFPKFSEQPTNPLHRGTFDLSLLAGIASHLSYWAEEDVSHFVISQLLSRHRVLKGELQRKGTI